MTLDIYRGRKTTTQQQQLETETSFLLSKGEPIPVKQVTLKIFLT